MPKFINASQVSKVLKKEVIDLVAQKADQYNYQFTKLLKDSVEELDVIDTRNLQNNSYTETNKINNGVKITATSDTDYAIYPFLGLGSSRQKGPRNWLALWVSKVGQIFGFKYKFKTIQPKAYKDVKKGYSIKSYNEKNANAIKPGKGFVKTKIKQNKKGQFVTSFKRK